MCSVFHANVEMPFFNQDIFDLAQTIKLDPNFIDPNFGLSYNQALKIDHGDAGWIFRSLFTVDSAG